MLPQPCSSTRQGTNNHENAPSAVLLCQSEDRRALEEGMSPEMEMTFTGHADYDTMKPYIALTDKTRQSALLSSFIF